jgi:hypothetical protein
MDTLLMPREERHKPKEKEVTQKVLLPLLVDSVPIQRDWLQKPPIVALMQKVMILLPRELALTLRDA